MSEQQLNDELALLKSGTNRPLQIDEVALLDEFQHDQEHEGSLGMKILSILGALLATAFFLGFIFVADVYDSAVGLTMTGLILIGASYVLSRPKYAGLMADAFSVSFATCGYMLLLIGLVDPINSERGVALAGAFIAGTILVLHENRIVTFLATVTTAGSLLFLAADGWESPAVHFYVGITALLLTVWFLFEGTLLKVSALVSRRYDGIRTGLIFALIMGTYYLSDFNWWMGMERAPNWYVSVILIPLTGLVTWQLLRKFVKESATRVAYLTGTLTLLLPTVFAPAICAALLILLLSWRSGYRTGAAIAVIALVYFVSRYYYDLNLTLFTKAIILSVSGLLFLAAYRVLHQKISPQ
ncbi:DUF4401 domain-containing protein [Neolewinella persica]|uniref:DUF4401 domain-containing protein n=1 Tax=Neolewinella persica TaxID=70998 RepID=UPI00037B061C|nr:DUF4401 domain-containing protein [Neolewinella persica]